MKSVIVAAAIALVSCSAQAGELTRPSTWLCGTEPTRFAYVRASGLIDQVRVTDIDVITGRYEFSAGYYSCTPAGCEYHGGTKTPISQSEWVTRLKKYEKTVDELEAWADGLGDACLSNAYRNVVVAERVTIAKTKRALEFMKSPEPLGPSS